MAELLLQRGQPLTKVGVLHVQTSAGRDLPKSNFIIELEKRISFLSKGDWRASHSDFYMLVLSPGLNLWWEFCQVYWHLKSLLFGTCLMVRSMPLIWAHSVFRCTDVHITNSLLSASNQGSYWKSLCRSGELNECLKSHLSLEIVFPNE